MCPVTLMETAMAVSYHTYLYSHTFLVSQREKKKKGKDRTAELSFFFSTTLGVWWSFFITLPPKHDFFSPDGINLLLNNFANKHNSCLLLCRKCT